MDFQNNNMESDEIDNESSEPYSDLRIYAHIAFSDFIYALLDVERSLDCPRCRNQFWDKRINRVSDQYEDIKLFDTFNLYVSWLDILREDNPLKASYHFHNCKEIELCRRLASRFMFENELHALLSQIHNITSQVPMDKWSYYAPMQQILIFTYLSDTRANTWSKWSIDVNWCSYADYCKYRDIKLSIDNGHGTWHFCRSDVGFELDVPVCLVGLPDSIEEIMLASQIHSLNPASITARRILNEDPLFLDTETTGLGLDDEVIQVAVTDSLGDCIFHSYIKPTKSISPEATKIHGITNTDVAAAPRGREVLPGLFNALQDRKVVMYNADFDRRMLYQSAQQQGISMPNTDSV